MPVQPLPFTKMRALACTFSLPLALLCTTVHAQELIDAPSLVMPTPTTLNPNSRPHARQQLTQALMQRGVPAQAAQERIQALSDAQIHHTLTHIDQAPAPGSVLIGSIVFGAFALFLTDAMGYTQVYPFTRRTAPPTTTPATPNP